MKLTKEQKHAKWIATPIARVERPLRYIADQTNMVDPQTKEKIPSKEFLRAFRAAYYGEGHIVQQIALKIARA